MIKLQHLRCPNWIKSRLTPTGIRKAKKNATRVWDYNERFNQEPEMPPEYERCGGELTVTVSSEEEPCWGGCSPTIEITVKCSVCGQSWLCPRDRTTENWAEELVAEALDARGQAGHYVPNDG